MSTDHGISLSPKEWKKAYGFLSVPGGKEAYMQNLSIQLDEQLKDEGEMDAIFQNHLMMTCLSKDLDCVKVVTSKIKPDYIALINDRIDQPSALHLAVWYGLEDILMHLLEVGLNIETREPASFFTPLHFAAEMGNLEITRILLQHGANINAKEKNGWSPSTVARNCGKEVVAELLECYGKAMQASG